MITLTSDILEIKFSGGEISPEKISLSELSSNILLFEKLVKPIVELQHPDLSLEKSFVGLHELGNRSISLRYKIKEHKQILLSAFAFLIQAITTDNTTSLPLKTTEELENISKFNSKYSCTVNLGETIGDEFKTYAHFTNDYIAEEQVQLKGSTTVYGKIQWIGGDKPTIKLILTNGDKLDVLITENDISNWRAHTNVGIVGDAVWKGKNLKLTKLIAKEIFLFNKLTPNEGFNHLNNLFSKHTLSTDNI
jgi:hypothetical protein